MNSSKLLTLAAAAVWAATAAAASAQNMKPGLWEMTHKMGGSPEVDKAMAQMQQQLASMPPEQRKMMQDMMAKKGVAMGAGAGGAMAMKACITPEMAARNQMPMQQRGDCTHTTSDKSSSGMKMKFTCTNPPSSGEGQLTFSGDSAYTMLMKINTTVDGKPQATTMEGSGKWLGADCGSIKPMGMPKP